MATTSGRNSPDGQGPWDGHGPWALSAWLHFFDPTAEGMGDDRSWWWWDAGFDERHTGWIEVVTSGWPFGSGSLSWLITAGGGGDLKYPS
ncbi:hypothetical protein [Streptomyces sp. NPDC005244]|uniref:hypothetical protein n=1 Tax=Streptomyces sp. NPDC005244 TaxID=3364708 RepID=UPI0036A0AC71